MKPVLLALACALAAPGPVRAEGPRGSLAALGGDRGELLGLFDTKGGFGVIQVAAAAPGPAAKAEMPVFPLYAGLEASLEFTQPGPIDRLDRVAVGAEDSGIERPTDLRDAVAAVPAAAPGASQLPPLSIFKPALPAVSVGPAGWLVITRKAGREVRPLKTREEVSHWTAAAQLQLSAYEAILLERFQKNLGELGKAAGKSGRGAAPPRVKKSSKTSLPPN